jgi:hypothetical protein
MDFIATPFNFSTTLLIAFAVWVMCLRAKAPVATNIPLIFYGIMIYYALMYETQVRVPPMLIYVSLLLALVLRFEFMNATLTKVVGVLEVCTLTLTVYFCLDTIYRW